jgi:hypothetical protein
MVWGTRKVCEEASHNRFASLSLPSQLPTNIENMLGYAPPSYAPRRPPSHARAIRRPIAIAFSTVSASSTSLVCKSELEVDFPLLWPGYFAAMQNELCKTTNFVQDFPIC